MSTGLLITNDEGVRILTVDAPPVNLLTGELTKALYVAGMHAAEDDSVRVVVLRSDNPDFFLAHFDVQAILDTTASVEPMTEPHGFHRLCELYRTMPKPTIAMIDGRVGGGGAELSASFDMRFGTDRTIINQMEVGLGILPGGSGTQRLPHLVGLGRAMEVVLGSDDLDAETAAEWGWLNRVLPEDELEPFVYALATRIASFPAQAVANAKAAVLASQGDPTPGLVAEGQLFDELKTSEEAVRRMQAFLAQGGQQPDAESKMGQFVTELAAGARLVPDGAEPTESA